MWFKVKWENHWSLSPEFAVKTFNEKESDLTHKVQVFVFFFFVFVFGTPFKEL